jgi:hypothetical protein
MGWMSRGSRSDSQQGIIVLHSAQTGYGAHSAHPAFYPVGTRDSFPGIKQLGHKADSPTFNARVKNVWNFVATSHTSSWHCLIKHRDNFAFYKVDRE